VPVTAVAAKAPRKVLGSSTNSSASSGLSSPSSGKGNVTSEHAVFIYDHLMHQLIIMFNACVVDNLLI